MEKAAIINDKEIKILDIETLEINPKDTIIVTVDPNIWSFEDAKCIIKFLSDYFPANKNLVKMKGVGIEIKSGRLKIFRLTFYKKYVIIKYRKNEKR